MNKFSEKIDVEVSKIILSSDSLVLKTETFLMQTKYILNVDTFLLKLAENINSNFDKIFNNKNLLDYKDNSVYFRVETIDKTFQFLIKFGFQLKNHSQKDIIFYKYLNNTKEIMQNDTKIIDYLQKHQKFSFTISSIKDISDENSFKKLYRMALENGINFPFLSKEQLDIISTENQNIVVQGVAGSGKTNVCIEKLIWTASKNYSGKILYTTFSRGLLNDTKLKVDAFKKTLENFLIKYKNGNIVFLDKNHKKAIENYLGIFFFVNEDNIADKILKMIYFFENNIDYFLIEDLYKKCFDDINFADEEYFLKNYLSNIKNHQIQKMLQKLKNYSNEIIYKEVFGVIFGFVDNITKNRLTEKEYIELRNGSFEKSECEIIYRIALDYENYLISNNFLDNNLASKIMLKNLQKVQNYSLTIIDEVQDFSQVNLILFKDISLKLFCAGDALQMINPSYFSFRYLKNILYSEDAMSVLELKNNYRNTIKIQEIIDALEEINIKLFGTHNFISSGKGIESGILTNAIYCNTKEFIETISKNKYDNFTIVVSSKEQKNHLRKYLKNQEILTIAEIKGLERDTVLLYNLLSDNSEKWSQLTRVLLNKKDADENSVYRYYYNIFYVGISRAKHNLFVIEQNNISIFSEFFKNQFNCQNTQSTINTLSKIVSKIEFTQSEYLQRVYEFLKLSQFENARFSAEKITDNIVRNNELLKIDIHEKFVHHGKYREAGIRFWENGLIDEAKKQFVLSGDKILIDLIDALSEKNNTNLSYDIIKYFNDVKGNDVARQFILETIKRDLMDLKNSNKELKDKIKKIRSQKNGK